MKKLFFTMLFVLTASISFAQCSYTYNSYFTGKTRVIISESNGTYTKTTWDENGDMVGSQTVSASYAAQQCSQKAGFYASAVPDFGGEFPVEHGYTLEADSAGIFGSCTATMTSLSGGEVRMAATWNNITGTATVSIYADGKWSDYQTTKSVAQEQCATWAGFSAG